jgi:5-bromo-4-chloroindolyl phosphate hydrolysis protein
MKKLKKKRSVIPVYLIALVWAVGGFGFQVHTALGFAVLIALSILVFLLGRAIWRDRTIVVSAADAEPEEEQPKQAPKQETPKQPEQPEDPEIAALRKERDRAVGEMRRLNDNIADPVLTQQIDHIEATTGKIFSYVMDHPDKKGQIRRFLNYYLPTTIKLLNAYDRLDEAGISGVNIDGAKGRISEVMSAIVSAFDRQLDALYQGEVMDINAEIKVLESLLTGDGLHKQDTPMEGQTQGQA